LIPPRSRTWRPAGSRRPPESALRELVRGRVLEHLRRSKSGTRVAVSCCNIQTSSHPDIRTANALSARHVKFTRAFCGQATKYLDIYIGWLGGTRPVGLIEASYLASSAGSCQLWGMTAIVREALQPRHGRAWRDWPRPAAQPGARRSGAAFSNPPFAAHSDTTDRLDSLCAR
jgi:hypothetical protein